MKKVLGVVGLAWLLASTSAFLKWRREGGHLPDVIEKAPAIGETNDSNTHQIV